MTALAACTIAVSGCTSMAHTRVPTTLIVVDVVTGEPAPHIDIRQAARTGYISKAIVSNATTGADGSVLFDVIHCEGRSNIWRMSCHDPSTVDQPSTQWIHVWGTGSFPRMFKKLAEDRYQIPLWPSTTLLIEIPNDFVGLVSETPLFEDSQDGRGWMPPCAVDGKVKRVARIKPDRNGVVSYPTAIAGFRGFRFDQRKLASGTTGATELQPLEIIAASEPIVSTIESAKKRESIPRDYRRVYAWQIWCDKTPPTPSDPSKAEWARNTQRTFCWFIGTLNDLRQWILQNHLVGTNSYIYREYDRSDPAAVRVFEPAQLLPLIPEPASQPTSPAWID